LFSIHCFVYRNREVQIKKRKSYFRNYYTDFDEEISKKKDDTNRHCPYEKATKEKPSKNVFNLLYPKHNNTLL
jgi:hypothetical protein